jgi:hypothetical protein
MHITSKIYEERMLPRVRTIVAPTRAVIHAQQRPALMGNMRHTPALVEEYIDQNHKITNDLIKQGVCVDYVEMMQIYVHAKSYYACDTHDPSPNVPGMYKFNENKADAMWHYHLGKQINNDHGYHSVHFDEDGSVKGVGYIDDNEKLQYLDIDAHTDTLQDIVDHARTLTAPTYHEAVAKIIEVKPELAAMMII